MNGIFKEINQSTQLEFFIDFELKNPILNAIMKKSFELGLNKIAKSFEERAINYINNAKYVTLLLIFLSIICKFLISYTLKL